MAREMHGETPQEVVGTARRALWWSVANNLVGRAGTALMGIALARILVPEDYGVYAVALVALNALLSMNELGVSLAIVRWKGDVSRIAPTVKTVSMASSVVLWVITFASAPLLAGALDAPEATNVLRLLTLSVLIDAATAVPSAMMTREFLQKERLIVDTAGFVVSSTTAIALAVAGYGAWALVWSALLGNVVNALFILRYAPGSQRYGFDRRIARSLLAFGLPLALASLVLMALLNLDYVVIGAHLGPVELGFYLLAFNLCTWPVNMFSAPARRVSLPLFARLHAGETDASAAFVPVCVLMLLGTLPACLVLAAFAEPLITTVYGEAWAPAAAALPWLMVLALTRVVGELVYDFLVAIGASRANLALQLIWLVTLLAALPVAVRLGGIAGVAMAHAGVAVLVVLPAYAVVLRRAGVSLRAMAAQLLRPLAGTAAAAAAGVAIVVSAPGSVVGMAIGATVIALIYAACVYPMHATLGASIAGPA